MTNKEHRSEVARLRAQIAAEYYATQQALFGPARGMAQHRLITARMERMGGYVEELAEHVGIEEAARILAETMESTGQHT